MFLGQPLTVTKEIEYIDVEDEDPGKFEDDCFEGAVRHMKRPKKRKSF